MNSEVISQLVNQRPFEPFTVRLSGGERYEVRHPENVAVGKSRLVIVDPETDRLAICSLLHVTAVEASKAA